MGQWMEQTALSRGKASRSRRGATAVLWLAYLVCMTGGLILTGCEGSSDSSRSGRGREGKPVVVTSIPPLASLVRPLVADWGRVDALLPAGATVHGFEPSASQMHLAAKADLLIVIGRNLDGWSQTITTQAAGKRKVRVVTWASYLDGSAGLNQNVKASHDDHDGHGHHDHAHHDHDAPKQEAHNHDSHAGHDHSGPNPHFWLDPVLARQFIQQVLPEILALAPNDDAKAATQAAAESLDQKLARLDEQYKEALTPLVRKDLVTFHNAFDLLASRYGLRVAAHLTDVELAPGGEVTASQLIEAVQTIRKLKLKVLYAEPQFPDRATQVITQETGAQILRLDPLGGPGLPGYSSYFEMMDSNLKVIVQGQSIP